MKQFEKVNCKYGAPMGRPEILNDFTGQARCFKVIMVNGDYDDGGCYWGGYQSLPLYCATNGKGFMMFTMASSRKEAKVNLQSRAISLGKRIKWIN